MQTDPYTQFALNARHRADIAGDVARYRLAARLCAAPTRERAVTRTSRGWETLRLAEALSRVAVQLAHRILAIDDMYTTNHSTHGEMKEKPL